VLWSHSQLHSFHQGVTSKYQAELKICGLNRQEIFLCVYVFESDIWDLILLTFCTRNWKVKEHHLCFELKVLYSEIKIKFVYVYKTRISITWLRHNFGFRLLIES
jgi:hypothetical protein